MCLKSHNVRTKSHIFVIVCAYKFVCGGGLLRSPLQHLPYPPMVLMTMELVVLSRSTVLASNAVWHQCWLLAGLMRHNPIVLVHGAVNLATLELPVTGV